MGELIIKLNHQASEAMIASGGKKPEEIARTLQDFNARLVAPAQAVGESRQYFHVEGVKPDRIEDLRRRMAPLEGVEAAYIKPSDELP